MIFMQNIVAGIINTSPLPQLQSNPLTIVVNIVFGIAASIALLMAVIGGFRYVASNGDPNATASAKNTIMYSIIGLLIVMAAYSIVAFVVNGVG